MSTVDEIKAAAAGLTLEKKIELHRWLFESEEMRAWQLEELKREIQKGIDSLEQGRFTEHDEASLGELARDIKARGREALRAKTH